ncbi:MAG: hypothetical protein M9930_07555 [Anaerolineae bacterium]|nr:hypothetical protein [Anaerolineae bacterium]
MNSLDDFAIHDVILTAIRELPPDAMQPIADIEAQVTALLTRTAALEAGDETAWDDIEAVTAVLVEYITGAEAWTGSRYSLQRHLRQVRPSPAVFIPTGF